jgi:Leucine-rich repeat (LRR) protein
MNPVNLFKFLEKQKGKLIPFKVKIVLGLPLTPEELDVEGNINLIGSRITSLPEGLRVRGWVDLGSSSIKSLPENLFVLKSLVLSGTPIRSLPSGLHVGGSLVLEDSNIESLPSDLKVGRSLNIISTPLAQKSDEEIRAMLTTGYIKGIIHR